MEVTQEPAAEIPEVPEETTAEIEEVPEETTAETEEASEESVAEAEEEPEEAVEEVPEDEQPQTPEPPVVERDKAKVRALTREERELYAPFIQSKSAREQLVKAIDNISLAAYTGNVIITGEEGMDTLSLGKKYDPGDSGYRQQFLRKSCQNLRPCAEQKRCSRDPEQTAERCTYHL